MLRGRPTATIGYADAAVRSQPSNGGNRMTFVYRLENADGTPADPPKLITAVPNWRPGDTIPLGRGKTLHVIDVRDDADGVVLVVGRRN